MGNFDQYTVDEIREIVEADDPERMRNQAAAWRQLQELWQNHTPRDVPAPEGWKGATADAFGQHLAATSDLMAAAATISADNGRAWEHIADRAEQAREDVIEVHGAWRQVRDAPAPTADARYVPSGITVVVGDAGDTDAEREPYDREARAIMDSAVVDIEELSQQIREPDVAILPHDPSNPGAAPIGIAPVDGGAENDDMSEEAVLQNTGWHSSGTGGGMPGSVSTSPGSAPSLNSPVPQAMSNPSQQTASSSASASGPGTRVPMAAPTARPVARPSRPRRRTVATRQRVRLDNVGRPKLGTVNHHTTDEQPTERPLERYENQRLSSREDTSDGHTVPGVITSSPDHNVVHDPGPVFGRREE